MRACVRNPGDDAKAGFLKAMGAYRRVASRSIVPTSTCPAASMTRSPAATALLTSRTSPATATLSTCGTPATTSWNGAWQHLIELMLLGTCKQNEAYRPWMTIDVRDDADAHLGLLESDRIGNGERYVVCSTERRDVEDVCASIARLLPELGFSPPPVSDPFPDRIRAREAELRGIWAQTEVRNDRVRMATGVTFRPLDDSIRDCVESLLAVGGVVPAR